MKKEKTITSDPPPSATPTAERAEWIRKYEEFKTYRDDYPRIRATYASLFPALPPSNTPTIMLSLRVEYYLWKHSLPEDEWAKKPLSVHQSYEASQKLNLKGLSANLQEIVSIMTKEEQMNKTKVKTTSTTSTNGDKKKQVFGKPQKVGAILKLPISQTWIHYLTTNKLTDEEILTAMRKEFPPSTDINIEQSRLTSYRGFYNRGGYNKKVPPKLQSIQMGDNHKGKEKKTVTESVPLPKPATTIDTSKTNKVKIITKK